MNWEKAGLSWGKVTQDQLAYGPTPMIRNRGLLVEDQLALVVYDAQMLQKCRHFGPVGGGSLSIGRLFMKHGILEKCHHMRIRYFNNTDTHLI